MSLDRRWLFTAVLVSLVLPVCGQTASCEARRGHFHRHRHVAKPAATRHVPAKVYRHVPPGCDWRRLNDDPRYYGGFNVSYFESIGLPSGDIGPRGNQIYWYPW